MLCVLFFFSAGTLVCPFSDLHMSDNEIGDKGLDGLAHALRRNKSVRLLELCFNRITAAGAEVLAKALWGCTTLRSLRLGNNQVGCTCYFQNCINRLWLVHGGGGVEEVISILPPYRWRFGVFTHSSMQIDKREES